MPPFLLVKSMNLIDFKESLDKGMKGAPIYIGAMTFWLKRWGTKESNKAIEKIKQELYGLFPDPKEMDESEIYAHWLVSYALVDWEEVKGDDGEPLECTARSTKGVILNPEYWGSGGLIHQLVSHAMNYENFLHDAINEDTEAVKK